MVKATFIVSPDESGLRPVFGVPAARRLALVAKGVGLDVIHVFGRDDALRPVLSDVIPAHAFHAISDIREFGRVAEMLGLADGDRVLVMQAGHVTDRWSLRQLLGTGSGSNLATCAGDGDGKTNGPGPICVATAGDLSSVIRALWSSAAPEAAEEMLLDALGRSTEATDSFLSRRIHRPISRFITKRLVKTGAAPNTVTLFNIIVGLAGAFFLAKGVYALQVLGSLLFLLSTILDGVDGEMARLTLKETVLGHYLDIVGDNAVHVAIFFGIALGLYRRAADPIYLHALGFLLCGFVLCALAVQRLMGHGPEKSGAEQAPWLAALLVNRDFAYLVVLLALIHRLSWFLFGATAGVYVVAIVFFAIGVKRRRAASA
jgi:phosphatidylglycerophosphate synthase